MSKDSRPTHLTYDEASARYGVKLSTLYTWVHRKKIPHVRLGNRMVRFPIDVLDEWMADRLVMPTSGSRSGS